MSNQLPHDLIIENGIVGSILKKPELILSSEYIKQKMFYNEILGILYKTTSELYDDGITEIDDITIITKINESTRYKTVLKDNKITDLRILFDDLRLVGTTNLEEYDRRCRRLATLDYKRKIYITLTEVCEEIISESNESDINETNLYVQDAVMKLSEQYLLTNDIELIGEQLSEIRKKIDIKNVRGQGAGLPSKFPIINDYFTYENGELIIIGGRAKAGKSMFFMNETVHKLINGCSVLYLDTEMNTVQWVERFLAHWTGIPVKEIKQKSYEGDLELEEKIEEAYEFLSKSNFAHIYDPSWTHEKILTTAKIFQRKVGLDLLVFDYIKVTDSSNLKIQEHNALGDMTNFLKNQVGGKLDIPVLAGGQMSPKDKRLADSDKINRYASVVAYWGKKEPDEMQLDGREGGNYKLFIDYNRLGKQMFDDEYINLVFNGDICNIQQARTQNHIDNDGFQ